jgi:hypothetical protein
MLLTGKPTASEARWLSLFKHQGHQMSAVFLKSPTSKKTRRSPQKGTADKELGVGCCALACAERGSAPGKASPTSAAHLHSRACFRADVAPISAFISES